MEQATDIINAAASGQLTGTELVGLVAIGWILKIIFEFVARFIPSKQSLEVHSTDPELEKRLLIADHDLETKFSELSANMNTRLSVVETDSRWMKNKLNENSDKLDRLLKGHGL